MASNSGDAKTARLPWCLARATSEGPTKSNSDHHSTSYGMNEERARDESTSTYDDQFEALSQEQNSTDVL